MKTADGLFVTGTDTGIGKTWATLALMHACRLAGRRVVGMKPVAAGCEWQDGWRNADALLLQQHSLPVPEYALVNPYAFEAPVSPHLAAAGRRVDITEIAAARAALLRQAELVLVEGAGGWLSPLDAGIDNAGLALALRLPVVLVVGLRLGCINHARLTYRAIVDSGAVCAGWIANIVDPGMQGLDASLDFLRGRLDAPLLGVLPHEPAADFRRLALALKCPEFLT